LRASRTTATGFLAATLRDAALRAAPQGEVGNVAGLSALYRPPKRDGRPEDRHLGAAGVFSKSPQTSFTFFSGKLRIGLPVAAKIAFSTAGAATQIVGSPTPPQKSFVGTITVSTLGNSARRMIS
jgi:hypothetical protein